MSETTNLPSFTCPHCGGEIQYDGKGVTARCAYCGASVVVPLELRPSSPAPTMKVVFETAQPTRSGRSSSIGCLAIIAIFLVIGGIVFSVVSSVTRSVDEVTQSVGQSAASIKATALAAVSAPAREPTRKPTPTLTPTPAFAAVTMKFGSQGIGPGQFEHARAVAVDGTGRIYVGEYEGGRIQVFDPAGKFINQFFAGDKKTLLLGFAVDRKGIVYIADGGDVTRYNGATGKLLGKLAYNGGPGFGELALAPDGSLYAMWYQRRSGLFTSLDGAREDLVHFDNSGKVLKVVNGVISSMTDNLELDNALVVDGRGNLYVGAQNEGAIFKFGSDGKYITRFGSSGEGAGQFGSLSALAIDGQGRLFVSDSSGIKVINPAGSPLASIDISGGADSFVFDDTGALVVATRNEVLKFKVTEK